MKKPGMRALLFAFCFSAFLSGCASGPADNSEAEAIAGANAALGSAGFGSLAGPPEPSYPASATSSAPSSGPTVSASKSRPAWVGSKEAIDQRLVGGVGMGSSRDAAEKNAFADLSSFFSLSLKADMKMVESYQESVRNGKTTGWNQSTESENAVKTSTSMDLVGAEVRKVWTDGKNYYALAVMDKAATARLYTQLIQDNQRTIDTLLGIPAADRDSMDSLARYQFAATLAEVNQVYANVLTVIRAPLPAGLKPSADYALMANTVIKAIPVLVTVENDRDGRIRGAFAAALAAKGFGTGGNNSRYQLQARLSLSEAPTQTNKFARYVVDGNFVDTATGIILFNYNINGREGHLNLPEAENRAVRAAENKIKGDYAAALTAFLSQLIPKR